MAFKLALVVAAACASAINGAPSSPLFDPVLFLLRPALAPLPLGGEALFHLSSIFLALATLAVAGIPAAVYERVRRLPGSTATSLGLWLVAALLLAIPGILGVSGYYSID